MRLLLLLLNHYFDDSNIHSAAVAMRYYANVIAFALVDQDSRNAPMLAAIVFVRYGIRYSCSRITRRHFCDVE
jgi:hypothetical protein